MDGTGSSVDDLGGLPAATGADAEDGEVFAAAADAASQPRGPASYEDGDRGGAHIDRSPEAGAGPGEASAGAELLQGDVGGGFNGDFGDFSFDPPPRPGEAAAAAAFHFDFEAAAPAPVTAAEFEVEHPGAGESGGSGGVPWEARAVPHSEGDVGGPLHAEPRIAGVGPGGTSEAAEEAAEESGDIGGNSGEPPVRRDAEDEPQLPQILSPSPVFGSDADFFGGAAGSGGSGAPPPTRSPQPAASGDVGGPTGDFPASDDGGGSLGGEERREGHGGSGEPSSQWAEAASAPPGDWGVSGESTGGDATPLRLQAQGGGGSGGPMDSADFWAASSLVSSTGDMPIDSAGRRGGLGLGSAAAGEDEGEILGAGTGGGRASGLDLGSDDPGSTPSMPRGVGEGPRAADGAMAAGAVARTWRADGADDEGRGISDDPGGTASGPPGQDYPQPSSGRRLDDPGGTPSSSDAVFAGHPSPASGATEDFAAVAAAAPVDLDEDEALARGDNDNDPGSTPALESASPDRGSGGLGGDFLASFAASDAALRPEDALSHGLAELELQGAAMDGGAPFAAVAADAPGASGLLMDDEFAADFGGPVSSTDAFAADFAPSSAAEFGEATAAPGAVGEQELSLPDALAADFGGGAAAALGDAPGELSTAFVFDDSANSGVSGEAPAAEPPMQDAFAADFEAVVPETAVQEPALPGVFADFATGAAPEPEPDAFLTDFGRGVATDPEVAMPDFATDFAASAVGEFGEATATPGEVGALGEAAAGATGEQELAVPSGFAADFDGGADSAAGQVADTPGATGQEPSMPGAFAADFGAGATAFAADFGGAPGEEAVAPGAGASMPDALADDFEALAGEAADAPEATGQAPEAFVADLGPSVDVAAKDVPGDEFAADFTSALDDVGAAPADSSDAAEAANPAEEDAFSADFAEALRTPPTAEDEPPKAEDLAAEAQLDDTFADFGGASAPAGGGFAAFEDIADPPRSGGSSPVAGGFGVADFGGALAEPPSIVEEAGVAAKADEPSLDDGDGFADFGGAVSADKGFAADFGAAAVADGGGAVADIGFAADFGATASESVADGSGAVADLGFAADFGATGSEGVADGDGAVADVGFAADFGATASEGAADAGGFADFGGVSDPAKADDPALDDGDGFADFGDIVPADKGFAADFGATASEGVADAGGFADFGGGADAAIATKVVEPSLDDGDGFADFGDTVPADKGFAADFGATALEGVADAGGFADFGGGADAAIATKVDEPSLEDGDGFADFGDTATADKGFAADFGAATSEGAADAGGFADSGGEADPVVADKEAAEGTGKAGIDSGSAFADFEEGGAAPEVTDRGAAPKAAEAAEAAGGDDDWGDDDDFADFEAAPAGAEAAAPDAEDWGFEGASSAPVQAAGPLGPRKSQSYDDFLEEMLALANQWCQKVREVPECATTFALLDEAAEAGVVADCAMDWEDWLQRESGMTDQVRELLDHGASRGAVPPVPFAVFGAPADVDVLLGGRSRVKESFFAVLGKHMELPSFKAGEVLPTASAGAAAVGGLPGVAVDAAGASKVEADWGAFEFGAPAAGGGAAQEAGVGDGGFTGDVLAQTMSDFGLTALAGAAAGVVAPPPAPAAPAPPTSFATDFDFFASARPAGAAPAPSGAALAGRSGGAVASEKVKHFLAGLPDLSHLYSSSVVAP